MSDLTTAKSFQDRISNKLRESIGELMTDEELAKVVNLSVDKMFFERPTVGTDYRPIEGPSWFAQEIKSLLNARMEEAVKAELLSQEAEISDVVRQVVQEGAGVTLMAGMKQFFSTEMCQLEFNISEKLKTL